MLIASRRARSLAWRLRMSSDTMNVFTASDPGAADPLARPGDDEARRARPVRAPAPRHRSQGAGLSPSRRPGTSWKLRNLRRWLFFLALAQYPANA